MGIQGLLPFLSTYKKEISFAELEEKVCGIDAYGWLYKGVCCFTYELVTGTETTRHIDFVIRRLQMLKDKGVQPVLVFNGKCPLMKKDVEPNRRQKRHENKVEALKLMDEGDHPKAMEAMKKSVTVSHDMAVALMKKCREKNFNYLISPYESDSQLTYLQKIDIIYFIMSEDSDLLVFGDPEFTKVIFKTNFDTESGDLIVLKDICGSSADDKFFTFTQDMFRIMCILSGCDYLASIRNIGLRRSFAAVKQNIDITTTMEYFKSNRQLDIPPEYEQNVRKSLEYFKSQIVIDPFLLREVSLYESCSQREVIFDKLTGMSAIHFMHGNIHPHTGQLKLLFDITRVIHNSHTCKKLISLTLSCMKILTYLCSVTQNSPK